ncbi:hypothetical protein CW304_25940 [Bacillus sp. UFRGS-B20]|nr:hypothetical protein CW304_25940 [Bacillus sp. UFRGS-B20]
MIFCRAISCNVGLSSSCPCINGDQLQAEYYVSLQNACNSSCANVGGIPIVDHWLISANFKIVCKVVNSGITHTDSANTAFIKFF